MEEDKLTSVIIGCAIKVHRALGPGLLESAYRHAFCHEARLSKLYIEVEKTCPLVYAGIQTKKGYRIDVLVERRVVIEIKAAKRILPVDVSQVQTYLTLTDCKIGLILNFHVRYMKDGIRRIINPSRPEIRPPLR